MDSPVTRPSPSSDALRWVAQAVGPGAQIRTVQTLAGGTSSQMYGIEAEYNGHRVRLVLRLFDNGEWLREEPDLAAHEAAALQRALRAGIATPSLVAYDETDAHCGLPAVLMSRLPGAPDLRPADLDEWLYRLAEAVLPIHSVGADDFPWRYWRYNQDLPLEPPAWSSVPQLWEQAIGIMAGPPPTARRCFIHRDYHPMNVLWRGGRVSGIVDWTSGCAGAANTDVAWCRGNLIHLHGIRAADRFLQHYQSLAGRDFTYHPFWDLMAIAEVLPGPPAPYPPWAAHGIGPADARAMRERCDEYLAHVLREL